VKEANAEGVEWTAKPAATPVEAETREDRSRRGGAHWSHRPAAAIVRGDEDILCEVDASEVKAVLAMVGGEAITCAEAPAPPAFPA
jgi:hypothetical protein